MPITADHHTGGAAASKRHVGEFKKGWNGACQLVPAPYCIDQIYNQVGFIYQKIGQKILIRGTSFCFQTKFFDLFNNLLSTLLHLLFSEKSLFSWKEISLHERISNCHQLQLFQFI